MAHRYFTKSELVGVSGYFKPSGTMGNHHATVTPQGSDVVIVGSASGKVTLKREDDTCGYDCGAVWYVRRPEQYRCPVRRAAATAKISQKSIFFTDNPVRLFSDWVHNGSGNTGSSIRDTFKVLGEYRHTVGEGTDSVVGNSVRSSCESAVEGGVVVITWQTDSGCWTAKRGYTVYVRNGADLEAAGEFILRCCTAKGQEWEAARKTELLAQLAAIKSDLGRMGPGNGVYYRDDKGEIDSYSLKYWRDHQLADLEIVAASAPAIALAVKEATDVYAKILAKTARDFHRRFTFQGTTYEIDSRYGRETEVEWSALRIAGGSRVFIHRIMESGMLQAWLDSLS